MNVKSIQEMVRDGLVEGLNAPISGCDDFKCPHCIMGKKSWSPYEKSAREIDPMVEVGQVIHADHIGKICPMSRYGNEFIVLFVDEALRMGFIFGVSSLDQTYDLMRGKRSK